MEENGDSAVFKPRVPLARHVADVLQQEIRAQYKAGDKLPTVRALCRRFDVSVNTVSMALDLLSRDGLVEKWQGSGVYVRERPPRLRIGILSELDLLDLRIGGHFRVLAGALRQQVAAAGMDPQLYVGHAEPGQASDEPTCPQFWTDVAAGRLAGAVMVNVPSTQAWHRRVRGCPIPAVGGMTPYTADYDKAGVMQAAVTRLAAQGCRRLGLLAWHTVTPFREAVAAAGLTTHDAWIRNDIDPGVRGAGWDEFREVWSAREGRPDGLVILDDMLFADAQMAMFELGVQVPRDLRLAVVTTRGAWPALHLPATVYEIDVTELAAAFVGMLTKRLRGEAPAAEEAVFPCIEAAVPDDAPMPTHL